MQTTSWLFARTIFFLLNTFYVINLNFHPYRLFIYYSKREGWRQPLCLFKPLHLMETQDSKSTVKIKLPPKLQYNIIIWMVIHNEARSGVMPHAVDKLHLLILAICLRLLCRYTLLIVPVLLLCSIILCTRRRANTHFLESRPKKYWLD